MIASTDVATSPALTFTAFTDAAVYSRWLGVPVTLEDGRFACTMEWGTNVRGRYELLCPPELIVMRWDFEDDNVPVPGGEMTAYLRIQPDGPGSRVEVHQLVETSAQAAFMEGAWAMVLGRPQVRRHPRERPRRAHAPAPRPPQAHPRLSRSRSWRMPTAPPATFMIAARSGYPEFPSREASLVCADDKSFAIMKSLP